MGFLNLINVSKIFNETAAVENFNLDVQKGEFVTFLGPSGCGKTTTLRMIAGFETPTSGQITINNKDITSVPPNRRNIGMVFQSYALFPNMNVQDNIGFGLKIAGKPKQEIKQRVTEMLALISMQEFGTRYPHQMSGGQQQRVALARALAIQPEVLLLDEPLSALDAKIRVQLRTEIRLIQQKLGITTIYVTHDQEEAMSLSDRVVVMSRGHIEQIGAPFEIYNFPKTQFVASFVGTLNMIEATVVDAAQGVMAVDGQRFRSIAQITQAANGEHLLVALRPEIISMQRLSEDQNEFTVQVQLIAFLGSVVRIQVRLGDRLFFFDILNDPSMTLPKVGSEIKVYFTPESELILGKPKVDQAAREEENSRPV
jgi:putative spermidine/putrescine transport system ATP-binding protein